MGFLAGGKTGYFLVNSIEKGLECTTTEIYLHSIQQGLVEASNKLSNLIQNRIAGIG
jgi:hypothetical protein